MTGLAIATSVFLFAGCAEKEPYIPRALSTNEVIAVDYLTALQTRDVVVIQKLLGLDKFDYTEEEMAAWIKKYAPSGYNKLQLYGGDPTGINALLASDEKIAKQATLAITESQGSVVFEQFDSDKKDKVSLARVSVPIDKAIASDGVRDEFVVTSPLKNIVMYGTSLGSYRGSSAGSIIFRVPKTLDVPLRFAISDIPVSYTETPDGVELVATVDTQTETEMLSFIQNQINLLLELKHLTENVKIAPIYVPETDFGKLSPYATEDEIEEHKKQIDAYNKAQKQQMDLQQKTAEARKTEIQEIVQVDPDLVTAVLASMDHTVIQVVQYFVFPRANATPEQVTVGQLDEVTYRVTVSVKGILKNNSVGTDEFKTYLEFTVKSEGGRLMVVDISDKQFKSPFNRVSRFIQEW